tara:strand:- start:935 stop:1153 length:219 start_codon:yes stop_codon:yes gene_type:complete
MLDKAIRDLQIKHPWMSYEEAFALMMNAYYRALPHRNKGSAMKTLIGISFGIYLREDKDQLLDRLARIQEFM